MNYCFRRRFSYIVALTLADFPAFVNSKNFPAYPSALLKNRINPKKLLSKSNYSDIIVISENKTQTEAENMLEIRNLTKTYKGGKTAVADLSLTVHSGDIYGFIGHNGAGKTTTIKSIVGIHDFDKGEILVDGKSVLTQPLACKQVLAYIPDNPDIYEYLTGIQYLNFIADIYKVSKKDREERIRRESEEFGIYSVLGDLVSTYSHGMRQKLVLIGALIHEPRLLVLDEPFVGLDPEASLLLKKKMRSLCDRGSAIFFSTHVLEVAEKLCTRIAVISGGRLAAEGDTRELTQDKSLEDVFMEVTGHDKAD